MNVGTATISINRPSGVVWAAVTDITRIGEWSPECRAGRWIAPATGPAVGARFEGDNIATVAGRTVKKWTTTSEVITCEAGTKFEFVAEGFTTWCYEFAQEGTGTRLTESFRYESKGLQGFVYTKLLRRPKAMTKGMERTLARIKAVVEQR